MMLVRVVSEDASPTLILTRMPCDGWLLSGGRTVTMMQPYVFGRG